MYNEDFSAEVTRYLDTLVHLPGGSEDGVKSYCSPLQEWRFMHISDDDAANPVAVKAAITRLYNSVMEAIPKHSDLEPMESMAMHGVNSGVTKDGLVWWIDYDFLEVSTRVNLKARLAN